MAFKSKVYMCILQLQNKQTNKQTNKQQQQQQQQNTPLVISLLNWPLGDHISSNSTLHICVCLSIDCVAREINFRLTGTCKDF